MEIEISVDQSTAAGRQELENVLKSRQFSNAERLRRFLRFVGESTLDGKGDRLNEYLIGFEVFDKPQSYDPGKDPIVRVTARRVRLRLEEYYSTDGADRPLRISLAKGSYAVTFERVDTGAPSAPPPVERRLDPAPPTPYKVLPWPGVLIIVLAACSFAALLTFLGTRRPEPRGNTGAQSSLHRLTSDEGLTMYPALSPDGTLAAYASDRENAGRLDLWVQAVTSRSAMRLTNNGSDNYDPSFSNDGSQLVFRSEAAGGGVYIIPTMGGQPRLFAKQGRHPVFSPDGKWIAYQVSRIANHDLRSTPTTTIYVAPSEGGGPVAIQVNLIVHGSPVWLPDSKHLLVLARRPLSTPLEDLDWWILSREGAEPVAAEARRFFPQFSAFPLPGDSMNLRPDGSAVGVVFSAGAQNDANIWRVAISKADWKVQGPPERLTLGTGTEAQPVIRNHRLAFTSVRENQDIWTFPLGRPGAPDLGPGEQLTRHPDSDMGPALSQDGKKLYFISNRSGDLGIWMKDRGTGEEKPLRLNEPGLGYNVLASPRSGIGFLTAQGSNRLVRVLQENGTQLEVPCASCFILNDWSADGREILYTEMPDARGLGLLELATRKTTTVVADNSLQFRNARFSPDRKWILFEAQLGPEKQQVVAVRNDGKYPIPRRDWIPITDGSAADRKPNWSPGAGAVYFLSDRDSFPCIWMQRVDEVTRKPVGKAVAVQHFHNARLSPSNVFFSDVVVGRNELLVTLGERTGNVWWMDLP